MAETLDAGASPELELNAWLNEPDDAAPPASPSPSDTAAPESEPASPAEPVTGQPRDASGKFAPKADAPVDPAPAPVADEVAPPVDDAPKVPLTFKVSGQVMDIPGSYQDKDGNAVLPKEQVDKFLRYVSQGVHHESSFRTELARRDSEVQRYRAMAEQAVSEATTKADAKLKALDEIVANPALLEQAIANPQGLREFLEDRATRAALEFKVAQAEKASAPDPQVEQARVLTMFDQGVNDLIREASAHPDYRHILNGPYKDEALALVMENRHVALVRGPDGQPAIDTDKIAAMLKRFDKPTRDAAARVEAQAKVTQATKVNAALAQTKTPAQPKTSANPGKPAVKPWEDPKLSAAERKYAFQQAFMDGKLDD